MHSIGSTPKDSPAGSSESHPSQPPPTRHHPGLSEPVRIEARRARDFNMLWTGKGWRHYHYLHYAPAPADSAHNEGWVAFVGEVYYGLEAPEEDVFYSCDESTKVWVSQDNNS